MLKTILPYDRQTEYIWPSGHLGLPVIVADEKDPGNNVLTGL